MWHGGSAARKPRLDPIGELIPIPALSTVAGCSDESVMLFRGRVEFTDPRRASTGWLRA